MSGQLNRVPMLLHVERYIGIIVRNSELKKCLLSHSEFGFESNIDTYLLKYVYRLH